ncbi:MAG TPA: sulfite exporter TauE/SafE family protein [Rubrivivax sp.]|nr:sulfite exporter TauE/SafE family protein [Rubrivivax sp.]
MAYAVCVVLAAGVVRGFAGFGFSAISVAGLALVVSPAQVVPPVFVLEVLASLSLLRGALRDVDWPWLGWLALGNAIAIPLGVALLAWLPETPLRLLIGALLLTAAALLRGGVSIGLAPSSGARLATGLISGLVNGVAAIGGIAVAVLLAASPMAAAAMRATLIALFLFTDLYALAWAAILSWGSGAPGNLVGTAMLQWTAWLLAPMLAGIAIGQRGFAGVSQAAFRRRVLELLIGVSALTAVRAVADLAG